MGRADGPYRRRVRVRRLGPTTVEAALEDDFHHFGVTLGHDGARVTAVRARSVRWPWRTCPDAGARLDALVGMALSPRCTAVAAVTDPRWQCTHQFDLAGLAVAHAVRDAPVRRYDVEVGPVDPTGAIPARLWRDGALLHEWLVSFREGLRSPEQFREAPWRGGFIKWADASLDPDGAEAAIVLRRACDIAMGRSMDLEAFRRADELGDVMTGVCYTMQPGVMERADRNVGSIRDFADAPDALLRDD
jgi:hypothetical protein